MQEFGNLLKSKTIVGLSGLFAFMIIGFSEAAMAADHPCKTGEIREGILKNGSPLSFQLHGSNQLFGLSDLVITDPDFSQISFKAGTKVALYLTNQTPDRYGRLTGQIFASQKDDSKSQTWLQGEMLQNGLALFAGTPTTPDCQMRLLRTENVAKTRISVRAKQQNSGLQASETGLLENKLGHFVIVTGKVLSVGNRKTRLYLNFGEKWSQDFTALIVKKGKGAFRGNLERLQKLTNAQISVRGIVEQSGGPMIRVTDEAQIEIIND